MTLTFSSEDENSPLPPPDASGLKVGSLSGKTDEDKPAPKRRGRPPGSSNKANLGKLEEDLKAKLLEELVVPIAFVSPLAAANVEARAERTAKAAVRLASKNPRVRKGIEKMLEGSDVFTLVMFPLSTAICAMVDFEMLPALSPPARAVGVPRLYEDVYEEQPPRPDPSSSMNGHHAGAARGLYAELDDDIHV